MKKFLLTTVAIAMLSTAASAADLDVAPEPIMDNWAGWYLGVNGGYGFAGDPDVSNYLSFFGEDFFPAKDGQWDTDTSGFFGGVQVGYNWQDDIYVYGLEGDFQFSDIKGKDGYYDFYDDSNCGGEICLAGTYEDEERVQQKLKWFSTIRGRAGVSPNENLLFYATAGLAFGKVKNKSYGYHFRDDPIATAESYHNGSSSKTKVGWTAGFGSELKVTENVSFKVEYLYLDFGKTTILSDIYQECSGRCLQNGLVKNKFKNQFHTVKAGFNWGF